MTEPNLLINVEKWLYAMIVTPADLLKLKLYEAPGHSILMQNWQCIHTAHTHSNQKQQNVYGNHPKKRTRNEKKRKEEQMRNHRMCSLHRIRIFLFQSALQWLHNHSIDLSFHCCLYTRACTNRQSCDNFLNHRINICTFEINVCIYIVWYWFAWDGKKVLNDTHTLIVHKNAAF